MNTIDGGTRCEECGCWTEKGKKLLQQRSKEHPIWGFNFNIPLSQAIEELRNELVRIRGKLGDLNSAIPGWGERTHPVEGLLTCGIVTLYNVVQEMRKFEGKPHDDD